MPLRSHTLLLLFLVSLTLLYTTKPYATELRSEPISPIPLSAQALSSKKVALGEQLFHDPRLSSNNTVSCASCHNLSNGGTDNRQVSLGIHGASGAANAPTVYNSAFNFTQFWDGRAQDLQAQVNGPIHNPVEMGSTWPEVVEKLSQDSALLHRFGELYEEGISEHSIRDAIATFEKSLVTTDAPFDRWLRGDAQALSPEQVRGYKLFKSYGCVSCHQGANVGGNMFAYFGAVEDISSYFQARGGRITPTDLGRFNVTGDPQDKHLFKVPSLRLAVKTAPYFHDGSVASLQHAIRLMARYQLGRDIPDAHTAAIEHFLHSLVGQHPRLQP